MLLLTLHLQYTCATVTVNIHVQCKLGNSKNAYYNAQQNCVSDWSTMNAEICCTNKNAKEFTHVEWKQSDGVIFFLV